MFRGEMLVSERVIILVLTLTGWTIDSSYDFCEAVYAHISLFLPDPQNSSFVGT